MMCQRMGWPPISTIGFGRTEVSSLRRLPSPPARIIAFMTPFLSEAAPRSPAPCPAHRSIRQYADLGQRHDQFGLQSSRPQLLGNGLTIVPGEQYHVIRLLADHSLIGNDRNLLSGQMQAKFERGGLLADVRHQRAIDADIVQQGAATART